MKDAVCTCNRASGDPHKPECPRYGLMTYFVYAPWTKHLVNHRVSVDAITADAAVRVAKLKMDLEPVRSVVFLRESKTAPVRRYYDVDTASVMVEEFGQAY